MKIDRYKKVGKNKYKVYLEDGNELTLYEDVILKYELLLKKEIENIEEITNYNLKYELYDKALTLISHHIRSEKEINEYLKKYTKDSNLIEEIIDKLKENNFLNEEIYLKSYINDKINFSNSGPLKIKRELLNLGFEENEIDNYLAKFDSYLIKERIEKYVNKQIKSNKKSLYIFKNKMLVNLINLGYEKSDILSFLDTVSLDDTKLKELEIKKLRAKYSKKYQGEELENIIKRKLYEHGYFN